MRTHDMSLLESSGHLLGGGWRPDAGERKAARHEVPRPVQELDDGVALDGDLDERGEPHELQVARPGRDDRRTVRLERGGQRTRGGERASQVTRLRELARDRVRQIARDACDDFGELNRLRNVME